MDAPQDGPNLLTQHGQNRLAKRRGLGKAAAERTALLALARGVAREKTKGDLRRYLDNKWRQHGQTDHYVVYGGFLYVYATPTGPLITVINLPGSIRHRGSLWKEAA